MRDLSSKKVKPSTRNRMKKQRKPINFRSLFKKAIRIVGGILLVALVAVTGYEACGFLTRTTFLRLERIEVNQLKRLTREEVIGLAGVRPGDDMLSLRLRRIGEQLSKNPWVEKVRVRRYFPHVLALEVTEREPVAVINMGFLYYVDKNGEVFKTLNEGDNLDYPVVTGISEEDMSKDPAGSKEALKKVCDLVALLSSRSVFRLTDISEIHYGKGFGFTLFTTDAGVPVKLGNSSFNEKLDRLARIYDGLQPQMSGLAYIDLDFNDRIIVKKT